MYQRRRSAAPMWGWAQVTGLLLGTLGACTAESSDPPMIVRGEGGSSGESGNTDTSNAGQSTSTAGSSSSSGGESGGAGEGGAAGASGESNGGTGGTGGTGAAGTATTGGTGGVPPSACTPDGHVDDWTTSLPISAWWSSEPVNSHIGLLPALPRHAPASVAAHPQPTRQL